VRFNRPLSGEVHPAILDILRHILQSDTLFVDYDNYVKVINRYIKDL